MIFAQLQHEVLHCPLKITGLIPNWLHGTFVRNGPVEVIVNGKSTGHWFDGLAMLHAFTFEEGQLHYSNKFLHSDAWNQAFKNERLDYEAFALDPCRSIFKKFFSFFHPSTMPNANVNIAKIAEDYIALTEIPLPIRFDLNTLQTLGPFEYRDSLAKKRSWESAHPHYDRKSGAYINYLIEYGKTSYYTIYTIAPGSSSRTIIARIPTDKPSYMHSFAITDHYIILTTFPLVVSPLDMLLKGLPFIKNFHWEPERGTEFIVIQRNTGQIHSRATTHPFFAFHHINAYENQNTLVIDLVTYEDPSIITSDALYHSNIEKYLWNFTPHLERFTYQLDQPSITSQLLSDNPCEFPRIHPSYDGTHYQFAYTAFRDTLYKTNLATQQFLKWHQTDCLVGEPVFIPSCNYQSEDDGVVITIVIDQKEGGSFLLILNAHDFQELARAKAPHQIPLGLHGQFFTTP